MDFLIGFSIFLLALIMVIMMIPGIFAGLESAQIDYDAVAYRTSVILCEDPGWPANETPWEQFDNAHKDKIARLGLSISSTSPNILSKEKVNTFFNNDEDLNFTEEDYRSMVIFGDLPYYYNISLKIEDDPVNETGNIAPDSNSGYMRRLVKLKEPGFATIDSGNYIQSKNISAINPYIYAGFSITLDYNELRNQSIDEAYRFMPQSEPVSITLFDFKESLNQSDVMNVTLDKIRLIEKRDGDEVEVPLLYNQYDNNTYRFYIDGVQHTMQGGVEIKNSSVLSFEMYPPLMFSNEVGSSLSLVYNMTYRYVPDESIPHDYIAGDVQYGYGQPYMKEPYLRDGVMEVLIW